jgi:hypothetical protein
LADCRTQIISKDKGCEGVWGGFEVVVVNGWPIDLVRIVDGRLLYNPLGINAERIPVKDGIDKKCFEGKDELRAWRDEAPFDIEW